MIGTDPELVTVGEPLLTIAPEGARTFAETDLLRKSVSGAEVNTAIGLARLGVRVAYLGLVGDDPFGRQLAAELDAEGVDTAGLRLVSGRTGLIVKERPDPHLARSIYYRDRSPASRMRAEDVDDDVLRRTRRLHTTGITCAIGARPRELVRHLLGVARASGVVVSFDVNMRPALWTADDARPELLGLLSHVDELLCNEAEAELLAGDPDALEWLAERGPATVIVKRGVDGAVALVDGARHTVAAVPAPEPVDPVGAGDAFNAGWLFGRLRGLSVQQSLATASWVAAAVVQSEHDSHAVPDLAAWRSWVEGPSTAH